ncbi:hypothetical protein LXL04_016857 [Taraxacum kok-saghyz]
MQSKNASLFSNVGFALRDQKSPVNQDLGGFEPPTSQEMIPSALTISEVVVKEIPEFEIEYWNMKYYAQTKFREVAELAAQSLQCSFHIPDKAAEFRRLGIMEIHGFEEDEQKRMRGVVVLWRSTEKRIDRVDDDSWI